MVLHAVLPCARNMHTNLAAVIEHTLLRADARSGEVTRLCEEARENGFVGVCVSPVHVRACAEHLRGSGVRVVSVVGFPLGTNGAEAKAFEAGCAAEAGADELDMVQWIGALKDGDYRAVEREVAAVVEAVAPRPVKVILETALLTTGEKVRACEIARDAGAAFVKTSTGFGRGGATTPDVKLLREAVGDAMGVKASGGIRDATTAWAMLEAGASRIGTSAGVAILKEASAASKHERGY